VRTLQKQMDVISKRHVCVMTKMCMSVERTFIERCICRQSNRMI